MIDDDALDRYARLIHERGRLTVNAERARPFVIPAWGDRTEEQRELDRRAASAVAAQAVHDAGLDLAAKDMQIAQLTAKLAAITAARSVLLRALEDAIAGEPDGWRRSNYVRARDVLDRKDAR